MKTREVSFLYLGFEINSSSLVSFATGKLSSSSWSEREAGPGVAGAGGAGAVSMAGGGAAAGGSLGSPTVILVLRLLSTLDTSQGRTLIH